MAENTSIEYIKGISAPALQQHLIHRLCCTRGAVAPAYLVRVSPSGAEPTGQHKGFAPA